MIQNDKQLFILIPKEHRAYAKALVDQAFAAYGSGFVNFDAQWTDGSGVFTHYAAQLPLSSAIVDYFGVAVLYRAILPEPLPDSGETEIILEDSVIRVDQSGKVIAAVFVTKQKDAQAGWITVHSRQDFQDTYGCGPYSDVPPI